METSAGSLHKLWSHITNKIKNAFTSIFLFLRFYNLNYATYKNSWKDDLSLLGADISARLIIACWCNIHAFNTARASRVLVSPRIMTSHTSRRALLGSLSKDDANGNEDARKQWSDWLNEEKQSCCTCGTHFRAILWRSLPNDNVKFPNLKF